MCIRDRTTYDDDFIENFFICDTHDTLMFITDKGQLYWLKVYKIPEGSRTAKGKAVVNLIDLAPDEQIMAIIPTTDFADNKFLTIFTKNGIVKRTKLSEYANIRSVGIKAINLDDNDTVVTSLIIEKGDLDTDDDEIIDDENIDDEVVDEIEDESEVAPHGQMLLVATKKGMCIKFNVADVRETGRVTRGVTAIKFKEKDDSVIGAAVLQTNDQEILSVASKGIGKRTTAEEYRLQKRAGKGVICMRLTNKTGDLVGIVIVDDEMDLMALTTSGKMIRVDMQSIRKAGRNTSGVKVVNVDGEEVVNIAICPKIEDEETSEESDQLNLGESDE